MVEAGLKLIGLRQHYFKTAWNNFDFIVVLLSLIGNLNCFFLVSNCLNKRKLLFFFFFVNQNILIVKY